MGTATQFGRKLHHPSWISPKNFGSDKEEKSKYSSLESDKVVIPYENTSKKNYRLVNKFKETIKKFTKEAFDEFGNKFSDTDFDIILDNIFETIGFNKDDLIALGKAIENHPDLESLISNFSKSIVEDFIKDFMKPSTRDNRPERSDIIDITNEVEVVKEESEGLGMEVVESLPSENIISSETIPVIPSRTGKYDNSTVINQFPDMATIESIVLNSINDKEMDIKMMIYEDSFIVCEVFKDGEYHKKFVVDYDGKFMNELRKIFLIEGNLVDESKAIAFSDNLQLLNFIKGIKVTEPKVKIVTNEERYIAKRVVNIGTKIVPQDDYPEFKKILKERIIPKVINGSIAKEIPDISYRIVTYMDKYHWTLVSDSETPIRFGKAEHHNHDQIQVINALGQKENGEITVKIS